MNIDTPSADAIRTVVPGLIMLLIYVTAVVGLSGCCAVLVNWLCPEKDDHKKYKITHISTKGNRKNYIGYNER